MALAAHRYLQVPGIDDPRLRYRWDDWNVEASDLPIDDALQAVLSTVSHRAVVAFTLATAEWIIRRFAALSDDPVPSQVVEAGWAQLVDFGYSTHFDINRDAWRGPVRGPLGMTVRRVKFAVQQAETRADPVSRAGRAARLAEHVLPDPTPYIAWRSRVLDRLCTRYPFDRKEKLGEVVPREMLDPESGVEIEHTAALVNRYLSGLDYRANPFLIQPHRMLERGFKGTPYVFDRETDRRNRFEW